MTEAVGARMSMAALWRWFGGSPQVPEDSGQWYELEPADWEERRPAGDEMTLTP